MRVSFAEVVTAGILERVFKFSERWGNNPLLSIVLSIDPDIIRHREG